MPCVHSAWDQVSPGTGSWAWRLCPGVLWFTPDSYCPASWVRDSLFQDIKLSSVAECFDYFSIHTADISSICAGQLKSRPAVTWPTFSEEQSAPNRSLTTWAVFRVPTSTSQATVLKFPLALRLVRRCRLISRASWSYHGRADAALGSDRAIRGVDRVSAENQLSASYSNRWHPVTRPWLAPSTVWPEISIWALRVHLNSQCNQTHGFESRAVAASQMTVPPVDPPTVSRTDPCDSMLKFT